MSGGADGPAVGPYLSPPSLVEGLEFCRRLVAPFEGATESREAFCVHFAGS
jgi:hypothetical protein